jgi:hypothetical protein
MPASPHIAELLAPDGVVAKVMGEGFEVRPQQRRMAEGVARAMETASHLLVEAGTGTGKSFAYLLPAALRAAVHGEVVVISTHTISLQEQLIQKDLPLIKGVIERLSEQGALPPAQTASGEHAAIKGVLVKGRGNYVSVRRLKLASERQDRLFADAAARRSLHVIEDWAMTTLDGTLSTLPPIERMGVWDKVQSDSGNCMGKKCPTYQQCFFQRARAEMDGANILVCNHALFFSDLALRSQDVGFLPAYKHVIFDEAHNIEEVASEHFGVGLTEGRVQHLLTTLYAPRSGKGYLPQLSLASGDTESITRAMALVIGWRAFFGHVAGRRKSSAEAKSAAARSVGTVNRSHPCVGRHQNIWRRRSSIAASRASRQPSRRGPVRFQRASSSRKSRTEVRRPRAGAAYGINGERWRQRGRRLAQADAGVRTNRSGPAAQGAVVHQGAQRGDDQRDAGDAHHEGGRAHRTPRNGVRPHHAAAGVRGRGGDAARQPVQLCQAGGVLCGPARTRPAARRARAAD